MFQTLRSESDLPIADSCWFPCIHHHQDRGYVCEGEPWPPDCLAALTALFFSFLMSVLPNRELKVTHRIPALHSGWSLLKKKNKKETPSVHHLPCSYGIR